MGNYFWRTNEIYIDNNLLIVDNTFNTEKITADLIHDFNIIFGMYTHWDDSVHRVQSGMPIIIRMISGILYYYNECMYAEDFIRPSIDIIEQSKITPTKINIQINEWLDIWDSFLKNLEAIDTHIHLLEYKNICVFQSMLDITTKMYKNVKDISI
jgi:hypothetical protein